MHNIYFHGRIIINYPAFTNSQRLVHFPLHSKYVLLSLSPKKMVIQCFLKEGNRPQEVKQYYLNYGTNFFSKIVH